MSDCLTPTDIEGLLAGTLPPAQAARAQAHLANCSKCRRSLRARPGKKRLLDDRTEAQPDETATVPDGPDDLQVRPVSGSRGSTAAGGDSDRLCDVPDEHLWSWVDRNSPELDEHLAKCPPCRARAERIRGQIERLAHRGTDPSARPDERIPGYEILSRIHSGAQGVVYKAVQQATKRTVALKVLLQGPDASPRQRHRFEREIDLVASLQHPHIVTVYDSGVTPDDRHYFAMEYVHGQPLNAYLSEAHLSIDETLRLFAKICAAVNYAHQRGVIHRDLKPGNIRIDAQGEPHVLDFGLAKAAGSDLYGGAPVTMTGEFMGTLAYASPEQAKGDPRLIDIRTDIYSLGVILYEMLTGKYPYQVAGQMAEVLRNIADSEPKKPSTFRRQIDDEVETIVLKALAKEKERRYQSAESLGHDIEHYLAGEPIDAKRDSGWYLIRKLLRRYRVPVAVAALLLFAVGVAAYYQNQASRAARGALMEKHRRLIFESQFEEQLRLGRTTDMATRRRQAIADCTAAIEQGVDLACWYALRAKLLTRENQNDLARRDCDRALELDPNNSLALRTLGFMHLQRGEFEAALEAYNKGLGGAEGWPEDFHNRARLRRIFGDYQLALADHDRAVELASETGIVYLGRGITRRFAGDMEGAIGDFAEAAELDPRKWAVQCNCWIWEMRSLGDIPGDSEAAAAALAAAQEAATDPLEKKMLEMCGDRLTADDLLRHTPNEFVRSAYSYYVGTKALVDGRRGDAATWLGQCRDGLQRLRRFDPPEFDLARWHLEQLAAD